MASLPLSEQQNEPPIKSIAATSFGPRYRAVQPSQQNRYSAG